MRVRLKVVFLSSLFLSSLPFVSFSRLFLSSLSLFTTLSLFSHLCEDKDSIVEKPGGPVH